MKNGFTLLEVVISIVVLGVLSLFSFSLIANLTSTYALMKRQRGLHQEAAYIIDRISRELREASAVFAPSSTSPGGAVLSFRRAHATAVDGNPYLSYYVSGGVLYRGSLDSGPPPPYGTNQVMGSKVTNFTATYDEGIAGDERDDRYTVSVTLSEAGQTVTYRTTVCPKNYATTKFEGRIFGGNYTDIVR